MGENSKLFNLLMERIQQKEAAPISSLYNFLDNFYALKYKKDNDSDKVHHAKANCQTGQYYDAPTALSIDYGRELWDIIRKNTWDKRQGIGFKKVLQDSKNDIDADNYGFMQGLLHPFANCDDVLDKRWLDNLNY